ncbi:hypothetical protein OL239_16775 [Arthrobacter sp. ATA002]|uniref:Imm52 family immunity protein n=1 Tax=Arthrobacter sp. ATA002 TaxID=2991715 RepID=UPI0022A70F9F|nr:Imm52 family immunity protein [Arthrobacter sp. ATA002]WAP51447.1 hypothetical protein OL239_16775 [Arthrobacter sp. ATA002]
MKKTVADLFSPEDGSAFIPLMWGGRKEEPADVAARADATMSALVHSVPEDSSWELFWMRIADDDLSYSPAPITAAGLAALASRQARRDATYKLSEATTLQLLLFAGNTDTGPLASFALSAGAEQTYVGNSCTVVLEQEYPLGTAEAAVDLFRELVRIWQPESAILCTDRTVTEIDDLYATYAGYATWISEGTFGVPPGLRSAAWEHFGDGTLLTAVNGQ